MPRKRSGDDEGVERVRELPTSLGAPNPFEESSIESVEIAEGIALPASIPLKTKAQIQAAIDAVKDGTIVFVGAYHENRKKDCLANLENLLG